MKLRPGLGLASSHLVTSGLGEATRNPRRSAFLLTISPTTLGWHTAQAVIASGSNSFTKSHVLGALLLRSNQASNTNCVHPASTVARIAVAGSFVLWVCAHLCKLKQVFELLLTVSGPRVFSPPKVLYHTHTPQCPHAIHTCAPAAVASGTILSIHNASHPRCCTEPSSHVRHAYPSVRPPYWTRVQNVGEQTQHSRRVASSLQPKTHEQPHGVRDPGWHPLLPSGTPRYLATVRIAVALTALWGPHCPSCCLHLPLWNGVPPPVPPCCRRKEASTTNYAAGTWLQSPTAHTLSSRRYSCNVIITPVRYTLPLPSPRLRSITRLRDGGQLLAVRHPIRWHLKMRSDPGTAIHVAV